MEKIKPFLIWEDDIDNVAQLKVLLPQGDRLVVPFVGAGNVFLTTSYPAYLLTDKDEDLINVFQSLIKYKQAFVNRAKQFFSVSTNNEEVYEFYRYVLKNMPINKAISEQRLQRACVWLYLNHHGAREQCCYHNKNNFDIPYGAHKQVRFPEQEMQLFLAKASRCDLTFLVADIWNTLAMAKYGDVIFCKIPQMAITKATYFDSNNREFTWSDHFLLFKRCCELEQDGIPVVIANDNMYSKPKTDLRMLNDTL